MSSVYILLQIGLHAMKNHRRLAFFTAQLCGTAALWDFFIVKLNFQGIVNYTP